MISPNALDLSHHSKPLEWHYHPTRPTRQNIKPKKIILYPKILKRNFLSQVFIFVGNFFLFSILL
jgi:hypothetical protein